MHRSALALVIVVSAVTGCARPAVLQVDDPGPPRSPEAVAVLIDPPERPYRTMGMIRSTARTRFNEIDDLKEQVREKAAELGADAVIVTLNTAAGADGATGVTTEGDVVLLGGKSDRIYVIGRAIRYTER